MKINLFLSVVFLFFLTGCIDISFDSAIKEMVSVNGAGDIALCIDNKIYITDLGKAVFRKVVDNNTEISSVAWCDKGLVFAEKIEGGRSALNIFKDGTISTVMEEADSICHISSSGDKISYVVSAETCGSFGDLYIYELSTAKSFLLAKRVYYDYKWLPDGGSVMVIIPKNDSAEGNFEGVLSIVDIDDWSENVIYEGGFRKDEDFFDFINKNSIILSSEGKIYKCDLSSKKISLWYGPTGYDFKVPFSRNSCLGGCVVGKPVNSGEDWSKGLSLVTIDGKIEPIEGMPLWTNGKSVVYLDEQGESLCSMEFGTKKIVVIYCEKESAEGLKAEEKL